MQFPVFFTIFIYMIYCPKGAEFYSLGRRALGYRIMCRWHYLPISQFSVGLDRNVRDINMKNKNWNYVFLTGKIIKNNGLKIDESPTNMNKSPKDEFGVYREEQFRVPSEVERRLGLWVDRVGRQREAGRPEQLRILGQYAHVQVLSGRGVYLSGTTGRVDVGPGDCMLVFPDEPCLYYPEGIWETCWVTWNGAEGRVLEESGLLARDIAVVPHARDAVARAHSELVGIMHDESGAAAVRRKSVVLEMVCEVNTISTAGASAHQDSTMMRAAKWMHDHCSEALTVAEIAADLGMSVSNFRRRFTDYTGRSPSAFIQELRLAEAKRMLREEMPIKHVAMEAGYSDVFYFMRVFKRRTGITAGEFQKGLKGL